MTKITEANASRDYRQRGYHFRSGDQRGKRSPAFASSSKDYEVAERVADQGRDASSQPRALHLDQRDDQASETSSMRWSIVGTDIRAGTPLFIKEAA